MGLYLLGVVITVLIYFIVFFLIAQKLNNNSIVDIGWGLGFVVIALYSLIYALINQSMDVIRYVMIGMIFLWGLRLFLYIGIRNFKKPEDFRYVEMRKNWQSKGKNVRFQAFKNVFMGQAMFMLLIALPIYAAFTNTNTINYPFLIVGLVIFIIGFFFEAVGDAQLRRFVKKPENKGHVMQSGLWAYTRHPNYFGEACIWWGIWITIALTSYGIIAIISPLLISYLLRYVSGVPLLEKKYANHPEFIEYAKRVPIFFPWFPKK